MQRVDSCLAIINERTRFSDPGLDVRKIREIKNGIGKISDRLRKEDERKVCLSFSHGDFSFKNIVITHQKTMVIDWEGAGISKCVV